jgi:hypothetical protein
MRDPFAVTADGLKTEGAVLSLFSQHKPEKVILLPTVEAKDKPGANSTLERAEEIRDIIGGCENPPECTIRPLVLPDPTDFEKVMPELTRAAKETVDSSFKPDDRLIINASSGTPQMISAVYVLANAGRLPNAELWQVLDPKFAKGRSRTRKVGLDFMEEEKLFSRVAYLAESFQFEMAAAECLHLGVIASSTSRRVAALTASRVFSAYRDWDLFSFEAALDTLNSVEPFGSHDLRVELERTLNQQKAFLEALRDVGRETAENLSETLKNSERCLARGAYMDALARSWRLWEGTIYFRLREGWGVDPRNILQSPDRKNGEKALSFLNSRGFGNRGSVALSAGHQLLHRCFYDEEYIGVLSGFRNAGNEKDSAAALDNWFEKVRDRRNYTIVAHGMRAVDPRQAEEAVGIGRGLLEALVPGNRVKEDSYPLSRERVQLVAKCVAGS